MATYIVRIIDRDDELCGIISEVATGTASTFTDAAELLAALHAVDRPGPSGRPVPVSDDRPWVRGDQPVPRVEPPLPREPVDPLTRSQLRVCQLAIVGKSNTTIAKELFVSRATVESHLHAAYRKLGIGSRFELPMALIGQVA
jgi:DNA-binding NarL/FixJ family response regulator